MYFASAVLPQLVGIKLCCQIAYNFFDRAEEKHLRSCASQDKCFFLRCSGIVAFRQTLTPRDVQLLLVNCIAISILLHFFAGILFNCSYNFSFPAEFFARIRQTIFVAKSFTAAGQFVSAHCSFPLQVSLLLVNLCLQITFFTFAGEFSCAYNS